MNVKELSLDGVPYRGVFPTHRADFPWKITAYLPSARRSTSGQLVGASWQTFKCFRSLADAQAAWSELAAAAREESATRNPQLATRNSRLRS